MIYLVTNITDSTLDPKTISIGDIPGRPITYIKPGQTIDLELQNTRNQICESHMIRVHVLEGRATVDTLGTEPDENCRIWVTGVDIGDVTIDNVSITEPIQISGDAGGVETAITVTLHDSRVYLDTNPLLPNIPAIADVAIMTANTEVAFPLPIDTKKYLVLMKEDDTDLEMSFASGGNTIPIPCGDNYSDEGVDAGMVTLYFKASKAPRTVKVLTWSVG